MEMELDWRIADLDALKKPLSDNDWELKFEGKTGVESWDIFKHVLKEETKTCVLTTHRYSSNANRAFVMSGRTKVSHKQITSGLLSYT